VAEAKLGADGEGSPALRRSLGWEMNPERLLKSSSLELPRINRLFLFSAAFPLNIFCRQGEGGRGGEASVREGRWGGGVSPLTK